MNSRHSTFGRLFSRKKREVSQVSDASNLQKTATVTPSDNITLSSLLAQNKTASLANQQLAVPSPIPRSRSKEPRRSRPDRFGLFTLYNGLEHPPTSAGPQYPVDIVAVHGLNGDAYSTWTAEKEDVNWVADYLPLEFPGSRIYSFGYDAAVFWSRGTGDINSFARELLNSLILERQERKQKRPIVFMCHSMGGLVLKRALNMCAHEGHEYLECRDAVRAILFFATPQRGSAIASLASDVAKAAKFFSPGLGAIRTGVLNSLKRDSSGLYQIAEEFRTLTPKYKIYSFQEMNVSPYINKLIVDQADSVLQVDTEKSIPMAGYDHRSIVQYRHKEEQGYRMVKGILHRVVDDATRSYIDDLTIEDELCLHSLSFPTLFSRKNNVEAQARDYLHKSPWITSHEMYEKWNAASLGLLWIRGNPGTGKSTLMVSIQRDLAACSSSQSKVISFFFDRSGEMLQKSQIGMFRSLLQQLYRRSIAARDIILQAFEEKKKSFGEPGKNWDWQLSELEALFEQALVTASQQIEITVLVDALDEAYEEDDELGRTAQRLVNYFQHLTNNVTKCDGRAKVCISCRHMPNISIGKAVQIVVEKENEEALREYVHHKLQLNVEGWNEEPERLRNNLIETLVIKADRQFLWASIRVPRVVESLNSGTHSFESIYELLDTESSKLSDLYKDILTTNVDVKLHTRAFELLQWILLAERPLSLAEIRYALACSTHASMEEMENCETLKGFVESDVRMEKLVKSLSGGLAIISHSRESDGGSTVRFIHQTVYDYLHYHGLRLLSSQSPIDAELETSKLIALCQETLSKSCINYWSSRNLVNAIEDWEHGDDNLHPFIEYSTRYWNIHAVKAEMQGRPQTHIIQTCMTRKDGLTAYNLVSSKLGGRPELSTSSSLMHIACASNLLDVVRQLLSSGTSANMLDVDLTPLHYAARWGHKHMADLLLESGADLDIVDWTGRNAIELAAANSHGQLVSTLLKHGAQIDGTSTFGGVLHNAAQNGNLGLVKFLIENGADVNRRSGDDSTALQMASRFRHGEIVRLLVQNGADINASGGRYGSPLQAASRWVLNEKDEDLVHYLIEMGADVNVRGGAADTALKAAIEGTAPTSIVKLLLDHGADVHVEGGQYGTALQAAARGGTPEVARLLLDMGANPNETCTGEDGSALHAAAASTWGLPIVQMLITEGADIHVDCPPWGSVLQAAAYRGTEATAAFLLQQGVDINRIGGAHGHALYSAISGERGLPMVKFLLDHGANIHPRGIMFGSLLEAAIYMDRPQIFRLLLERGADVHCNGDPTGEPPLFLLENYRSLLHVAAMRGQLEISEILLCQGLDINAHGLRHGNVLEVAVKTNKVEMVRFLLDKGVYVDIPAIEGLLCIAKGRKEMTKVLLACKDSIR